MDILSSERAAIWNTWVVFQETFRWIRFQLSNVRSPQLGHLGPVPHHGLNMTPAYQMHKIKGAWGQCWSLGSRSSYGSTNEVSSHSCKCWKSLQEGPHQTVRFPPTGLLDVFPACEDQCLSFLDSASLGWPLFRMLTAVKCFVTVSTSEVRVWETHRR